MENNWKQKSLESLEKNNWGSPPKDRTTLVCAIYKLRKLPLEKLQPKDLRLLLGQRVGLRFIIPIALEVLQKDLFIDAELYEGDLLQNLMKISDDFWVENPTLKQRFDELLQSYIDAQREGFCEGKI